MFGNWLGIKYLLLVLRPSLTTFLQVVWLGCVLTVGKLLIRFFNVFLNAFGYDLAGGGGGGVIFFALRVGLAGAILGGGADVDEEPLGGGGGGLKGGADVDEEPLGGGGGGLKIGA